MNSSSPFPNVTGVLFDVGDTLFKTTQLMARALSQTAQAMERAQIIRNAHSFCRTYKRIDSTVQGPAVNHLFSNLEITKKTWEALGLEFTPRSFGFFIATYRQYIRRGIGRNEKLIHLFAALQRKGLKIGIVTDGSTIEQIEQLFQLGVIPYIDALVTSEQIGREKPAKEIFQAALSALQLEPALSLMVGDDIDRDIAGAKRLGMRTILVAESSKKYIISKSVKPDMTVSTIFRIDNLIGE